MSVLSFRQLQQFKTLQTDDVSTFFYELQPLKRSPSSQWLTLHAQEQTWSIAWVTLNTKALDIWLLTLKRPQTTGKCTPTGSKMTWWQLLYHRRSCPSPQVALSGSHILNHDPKGEMSGTSCWVKRFPSSLDFALFLPSGSCSACPGHCIAIYL